MEKEAVYSGSNRVGKFNVRYELLEDGAARPWLQALFALCTVIQAFPNESGRGTTYIAASELFEPIAEGAEIPQYRIECELARPFTDVEMREQRVLTSQQFKFYAVRQIIVRVPPATFVQPTAKPSFH